MASIPDMASDPRRLNQIDGAMPRLQALPSGCAFHPRCALAQERCRREAPPLRDAGRTQAACWLVTATEELAA
jgi:peptide/nickel transport system ATP-binding protein